MTIQQIRRHGIKTVDEVERAIQTLKHLAFDPEMAHDFEDTLYRAVLKSIAKGENIDPPQKLAEASGICARCRRQRPHHDTLDWEEAEQRRLRSAFQKAGLV